MNSQRIVLALPDPPLPFGSAAARWFYVLMNELATRGHDVTALAACPDQRSEQECRDLFSGKPGKLQTFRYRSGSRIASKINGALRPYSYTFSAEMKRALEAELSHGYDVLHMEQLWTGWLGLEHASRALLNIHYSYQLDLAGQPAGSMKESLLRQRARQAERQLLTAYPRISTLTPELANYVRGINPRARVSVNPMGLDLSLYPFQAPGETVHAPVLGLIGSFNWTPSRLAGERILNRLWPAIQSRVPLAKLMIVGRSARQAFSGHLAQPGVEIHENVPEILPYFRAIDALLYAPPQASGIKVKLLEAFALGTPVITNSIGLEGIPAKSGHEVLTAETDEDLIQNAIYLLNSASTQRRLAINARRMVQTHFSPEATITRLENTYASLRGVAAA